MNFRKYFPATLPLSAVILALVATVLMFSFPSQGSALPPSGERIEVISEGRYLVTRSSRRHKKRYKRRYRHKKRYGYKKRYRHKKKARRKSRKSRVIAHIRNAAIMTSIHDLQELRPYANNFNGLKSAVRRYWKRHIRKPSTDALAGTIMRYVKGGYKFLVRSEVYARVKSGIGKVRKELRKNKL